MYITITKQKTDGNFAQSVADFVAYLEKENQHRSMDDLEHFFDQYGDGISKEEVIQEIDGNTSKLKKTEPKFYSITVNPSAFELKRLQNPSQNLKEYTRDLMKDYAAAFNREINGRAVTIDDIKYFAKIEHHRTFKGTDHQIRENQPYATKILELKKQIRNIEQGKAQGDIAKLLRDIARLEREAPHQQNGQRIVQGMAKQGPQHHIHIIVSRKDMSNSFSLSPGSKYKSSETIFNGKAVKRGFDRDKFFSSSEKTFDKLFGYHRNYAETYQARKTFINNPKQFFSILSGLPTNEKNLAFKLLRKTGIDYPVMNIPTNKVQLALKTLQRLKKGLDKAIQSGSIGI
ncbi:mobilization protein [Arenibacter sp. BSSL-BM3]|uniref:Mobilization protein n=1 Tax=Arenibacter arenosicollis TaxID=2762274 RepID=A0ABR7QRJ2_9FLAO|nr:MobB family relaxase [Arenibacter arenosicollis]MBC8769679.1 mobilization protein [Arenibacter arenosicollis]